MVGRCLRVARATYRKEILRIGLIEQLTSQILKCSQTLPCIDLLCIAIAWSSAPQPYLALLVFSFANKWYFPFGGFLFAALGQGGAKEIIHPEGFAISGPGISSVATE